jgi:hypothetical protein
MGISSFFFYIKYGKIFTFDEINENGELLRLSGSLPCRSRTENEGIFTD